MSRTLQVFLTSLAVVAVLVLPSTALGQNVQEGTQVDRLEIVPRQLSVEQGETAAFEIQALDAQGNPVNPLLRVAGAGSGIVVDGMARTVEGVQAGGDGTIIVTVVLPPDAPGDPVSIRVPVEVTYPAVARGELTSDRDRIYTGTTVTTRFRAFHEDGTERALPQATFRSSDPETASVDRFGAVTGHRSGSAAITAEYEGVSASWEARVEGFPAVRMELSGGLNEARTGDVLSFVPRFFDDAGQEITDIPVTWGYSFQSLDGVRQPGAVALVEDGRFLAEEPGRYAVVASAGPLNARRTVEVSQRQVVQRVEFQGQGRVDNVHTSDFWVFEGNDGRDYAISGTWGADGWAYMWDVTDPTNMVKTDSVQVDARTVNDVKVSPDARYATMTREGASNRRNGLVLLDLANPAHPVIASVMEEGLTGGVHNAFPMEDYVYTLSAGEKYLIIDVRDLANPRVVSEVQHGSCRIHDVWVLDGLAYSAQWGCGIIVYDVGNGGWGGSPENPVYVSSLQTPGGRTHAVYPYFQESTGKLLVFAGDEIMTRVGMPLEGGLSRDPYDPATGEGGRPSNTAGYTHILDFSDMDNPRKIARYKVPEYGTHNIWVEDDVLYQAYYEGGMRVVDVSGELTGNLATQGREIAVYKPNDPVGFISNAPMVWSAMPFKGKVFFSDWNSGMWSVELEPRQPVALEED
jgi:hypothetical protein